MEAQERVTAESVTEDAKLRELTSEAYEELAQQFPLERYCFSLMVYDRKSRLTFVQSNAPAEVMHFCYQEYLRRFAKT